MPTALRHLLVGHELTGIDASYLIDDHSLAEVTVPDSEFLFQNTNNRKKVCEWMTKKQVDHEIRVICKILGIIPKSSHDIRRTYASILDENGVPTALRKKLMGHSLTPMEKSYLVDGFSAKEIVIIMTGVYSKVLNNKVLAA